MSRHATPWPRSLAASARFSAANGVSTKRPLAPLRSLAIAIGLRFGRQFIPLQQRITIVVISDMRHVDTVRRGAAYALFVAERGQPATLAAGRVPLAHVVLTLRPL